MSEFIDNPFEDLFREFNVDEFKARVCSIIDKLPDVKDSNEMSDLLSEIDDLLMSYVIVLKLKGVEAIEVIKVDELPSDVMDALGLEDADKINGYVPKNLIPEEFMKKIESQSPKKKKNNNWLIGQ